VPGQTLTTSLKKDMSQYQFQELAMKTGRCYSPVCAVRLARRCSLLSRLMSDGLMAQWWLTWMMMMMMMMAGDGRIDVTNRAPRGGAFHDTPTPTRSPSPNEQRERARGKLESTERSKQPPIGDWGARVTRSRSRGRVGSAGRGRGALLEARPPGGAAGRLKGRPRREPRPRPRRGRLPCQRRRGVALY
jgi:hypothetical protein